MLSQHSVHGEGGARPVTLTATLEMGPGEAEEYVLACFVVVAVMEGLVGIDRWGLLIGGGGLGTWIQCVVHGG